jgi:hypothetical protein
MGISEKKWMFSKTTTLRICVKGLELERTSRLVAGFVLTHSE